MYATKSDLHQKDIAEKRTNHAELTEALKVAKKVRDSHALRNESKKQPIKEIVANYSEGIQILGYVSNEALEPDVFNALMKDMAYIGDLKVQEVYLKLSTELTATPDSPTSSSFISQEKSISN